MCRSFPGWPAALLVIAMMTASPCFSPAVLCVGEDGHVALESTGGGLLSDCRNCHDEEREIVMLERERQMDNGVDGCGTCSDFVVYSEGYPAFLNDSNVFGRLLLMQNAVATALGKALEDGRLRASSVFRQSIDAFAEMSTLVELRTVVLLC